MKIEYITYPYAFTDEGYRIEVDLIEGNPKVGSQVIRTIKGYKVISNTSDNNDCPNGVCPIK